MLARQLELQNSDKNPLNRAPTELVPSLSKGSFATLEAGEQVWLLVHRDGDYGVCTRVSEATALGLSELSGLAKHAVYEFTAKLARTAAYLMHCADDKSFTSQRALEIEAECLADMQNAFGISESLAQSFIVKAKLELLLNAGLFKDEQDRKELVEQLQAEGSVLPSCKYLLISNEMRVPTEDPRIEMTTGAALESSGRYEEASLGVRLSELKGPALLDYPLVQEYRAQYLRALRNLRLTSHEVAVISLSTELPEFSAAVLDLSSYCIHTEVEVALPHMDRSVELSAAAFFELFRKTESTRLLGPLSEILARELTDKLRSWAKGCIDALRVGRVEQTSSLESDVLNELERLRALLRPDSEDRNQLALPNDGLAVCCATLLGSEALGAIWDRTVRLRRLRIEFERFDSELASKTEGPVGRVSPGSVEGLLRRLYRYAIAASGDRALSGL